MEVRRDFSVTWVNSWDQLIAAAEASPASALFLVDPYAGSSRRHGLANGLAGFLGRFPSATVTAALSVDAGRLDDVRRLGEWGVVQVIDLDEGATAIEIAFRLTAARGKPLRHLVQAALPVTVAAAARSILATAAAVVSDGGDGRDLAKRLHVVPRTASRWCRRAGLPPPRNLLAWMRLLLAAELLDDPGRSVGSVALACGYSADSSLRLAFRRFVGKSPTDLRDTGRAFRVVADAFLAELAEARSRRARYRRRSRADQEPAAEGGDTGIAGGLPGK